jgi:hypothetical protein
MQSGGMLQISRHGGSDHFVRPDRVYATSVLQPVQGYQPNQDVQAVAGEFTQYPMSLQVKSGLAGFLGAAPTINAFQRAKLWMQSKMASKRTGQFMALTTPSAVAAVAAPRPNGGPQGGQVATEMMGRVQALAAMMGTNNPGFIGDQQVAFRRATARATVPGYDWRLMNPWGG